MNKVLFGIFLGVLFNIPTFGMTNSLGQYSGIDNNGYYNNNIRYDQTYENMGVQPVLGYNTFTEQPASGTLIESDIQNYSSNNNNNEGIYINNNNEGIYINNNNEGIYINNDTQFRQNYDMNNNLGDTNYNSNNNVQNYYVDNNFIYDNIDIQYTQFDGTNNDYNSGFDMNYNDNNNVQNYSSNNNNNEGIYINNDTQYNQFDGTNNNYNLGFDMNYYNINNIYQNPLSNGICDYNFKAKNENYLAGRIEQLAKEGIERLKDIKGFCGDFNRLDDESREELIKNNIKCGGCGGELTLYYSRANNKRRAYVRCKNKGCLRHQWGKTLEENLYTPYIVQIVNLVKKKYDYYFNGENEQFKKEDIEKFCKIFYKFDRYVRQELVKYIKCSCCGSRLALDGLNKHGKQIVRCKNEKNENGDCPRSNKRELLEVNLSSKKVLDVAEYK